MKYVFHGGVCSTHFCCKYTSYLNGMYEVEEIVQFGPRSLQFHDHIDDVVSHWDALEELL